MSSRPATVLCLNSLEISRIAFHTLYRKSYLRIPRNETARPGSQFLNSCICEQFIYIPRIALPIWMQQNRQTDPGNM
jgi:hypothetical protein